MLLTAFLKKGTRRARGHRKRVLIRAQCHILTAAHVVSGAEEIMVKTQDGNMHPCRISFSEASADIALIRSSAGAGASPGGAWRFRSIGCRASGLCIGSPYGLENSFSVGTSADFVTLVRFYDVHDSRKIHPDRMRPSMWETRWTAN